MNIILQHFDGELGELETQSIANIKKYAKLIGVDYHLMRGKPFDPDLKSFPIQKCHMISEEWDDYDNVVMADIDVFVPKGQTENVFDYPGLGMHNSTQDNLHRSLAARYPHMASVNHPYWAGIYKLDKLTRQKLRDQIDWNNKGWMKTFDNHYHYCDEGVMSVLATKARIPLKGAYLDSKWCQCSFLPNPEKAGMIHIRTKVTPTGPKRTKLENYKALVEKGIIEK